jgi:hypothetical protein
MKLQTSIGSRVVGGSGKSTFGGKYRHGRYFPYIIENRTPGK